MSASLSKIILLLIVAIISINVVAAWPLPLEHTDVTKRCGCEDDNTPAPSTSKPKKTKHHKSAPKKKTTPKKTAPKAPAPAPATSTSSSSTPKPTPAPKKSESNGSSGGNGGGILGSIIGSAFNGQATFYNVGENQGACGGYNNNNEYVAALSSDLYQQGANGDSWAAKHCYAKAKVSYGGKSIDVTIVDECPTCQGTSLDLSPAAFNALANPDLGVLDIKWGFVSEGNPKDKTPSA